MNQGDLTTVEEDILRMMVGGMFNNEIAFALDIQKDKVAVKIQEICEKLGVRDRAEAVSAAIERGLVRVDL